MVRNRVLTEPSLRTLRHAPPCALLPTLPRVLPLRHLACGRVHAGSPWLYRTAAARQGCPAGAAPALRASLGHAGRDGSLPPVRSSRVTSLVDFAAPARRPILPPRVHR
jgi:hypothetical protein